MGPTSQNWHSTAFQWHEILFSQFWCILRQLPYSKYDDLRSKKQMPTFWKKCAPSLHFGPPSQKISVSLLKAYLKHQDKARQIHKLYAFKMLGSMTFLTSPWLPAPSPTKKGRKFSYILHMPALASLVKWTRSYLNLPTPKHDTINTPISWFKELYWKEKLKRGRVTSWLTTVNFASMFQGNKKTVFKWV